ncbi:MAG: serine--tRNA ligase [Candidatus Kerfeldbacteria bacterium]|nr:serine--tRNA ligase [Candidatus Kerfeldbacteria bacterium]
MIDVKDLQKNPDTYRRAAKNRGGFALQQVEAALKKLASVPNRKPLEQKQALLNAGSKLIPTLKGQERAQKVQELRVVSNEIKELKTQIVSAETADAMIALQIPNLPKDDVPIGKDASDNKTIREQGKKPKLKLPKDYLTIAEKLGIIDVERAAKVSGSRFGYLIGAAAELEFALIHYAQDIVLPERFTMIVPPVLIKADNMQAMGYLAGGGERETYHFEKDDLYLVGTSEQSIGPMHRDETFSESDLPKRYLSFSTCFRREAGSYGKDTKGILRVHQFDKLEMFSFTLPEKSDQEHEFFLTLQERLWQGLEIPYRVVKLCTGELGFPSARTYDIDAWMPGQGRYFEVASTSTTTDYQSRDLNIKVQREDKKELVHMLNGTAFAIGRTLAAIIENYQQADGSVAIPKVLQPYLNGQKTISKPQ